MHISRYLKLNIGSPFRLFPISSIAPNIGISNADIPRMRVSKNTIGDWRFHFFITLSRSFIPAIDPRTHQAPVHAPQRGSNVLYRVYVIDDPKVVNMTRYIPVEDATEGGIPILRSTGLKIAPPPSPRAPDTQPPIKATVTRRRTMLGENFKSLLQNPLLYLILKYCSQLTSLIASNVTTMQIIMKDELSTQSYHKHF